MPSPHELCEQLPDKSQLRSDLKKKRDAQSASDKTQADERIFERLKDFAPLRDAKVIFTYVAKGNEVSTNALLQSFFGDKIIVVPKVEGKELCLYELHDLKALKVGSFGVYEPDECMPLENLRRIDVALIPGIAFDRRGYRIGYGGGFFDRVLPQLHCTTIGLAYEFQMIEKVPTDSYDVGVNFIITDHTIYECNAKAGSHGL